LNFVEGCPPWIIYRGTVPARFLVALSMSFPLVGRLHFCMQLSVVAVVNKILGCCRVLGGRVWWIFSTSPGCHTLSNAWLISRNTAEQYSRFSSALLMSSASRWHCWMVEWAFLNPNWCSGSQSWKCVSLLNL
jgi:hypothetical protein